MEQRVTEPVYLCYVTGRHFTLAGHYYGFHFQKASFFSHLTFVSPLPHVHYVFVHLLKIKAQWTVRGSFECGRAEKPPVSISKFGFVCSGLCVLCLF